MLIRDQIFINFTTRKDFSDGKSQKKLNKNYLFIYAYLNFCVLFMHFSFSTQYKFSFIFGWVCILTPNMLWEEGRGNRGVS